LEESVTSKGTTLWEAVLKYVETNQGCDRRTLVDHFSGDDPLSIGAVLKDLCENGLLYRTGSGAAARFRAVPEEEREAVLRAQDEQALAALIRVAIYRKVSTEEELARRLGAPAESVKSAVQVLIREGLVERDAGGALKTGGVVIPAGASVGWEAAVFDHYQALVTAITRKLAAGSTRSSSEDKMGGSTISFELTLDHPLREEVHFLLKNVRSQVNDLWRRVGEHNQLVKSSEEGGSHQADEVVTFYFGQSIDEGPSE
jgi:hypothetical protein